MSDLPPSASTSLGGRGKAAAGVSSIVGIGIALAGLAFVGKTLFGNWEETRELLAEAEWIWLVPAIPMCLLGMTCVGLPWRAIIDALGERHDMSQVLRWYFPGQLGKYVPGGVWTVVGRGELAVRSGVARGTSYVSVALSLALTYLAAALTALVFLVLSEVTGEDAGGAIWVLALLPLGLAVLHPAVLRRLVALAERVLSRDVPVVVPNYRTTVLLLLAHVPAWVFVGFATWLVTRAFTPNAPVFQVMFAGVLSWIVGFVVVPAPGGIGVREAAFAAAAVSLPDDVAATVAIVSRLCFITADLIGAGLVVAVVGRRRLSGSRTASPVGPPDASP